MDAVILAAGRGSRLNGIAAPFHKPLLVVNGAPLIKTAVDLSAQVSAQRCVIVAAPDNASPINHVAPWWARMVIQREPNGPGLALRLGLEACTSEEVLVLMGDNILTFADVKNVSDTFGNVIGVSMLKAEEAERFTRARRGGKRGEPLHWVEKVPVTKEDLWDHGMTTCWVGPIKINRQEMLSALKTWVQNTPDVDPPIGPLFNWLQNVVCVNVTSVDIGTPEALT